MKQHQQAEFAADLWQIYLDEGSDEYRLPTEFFRRTYLTEGLKQLLSNALLRLSGQSGDPVIELQTNFGGGKTHAMLALYHLFFGVSASELPGLEPVFATAGVSELPDDVKTVVLVGNKISPGQLHQKKDGTVIKTLWGEIAWQLGGKEGLVGADVQVTLEVQVQLPDGVPDHVIRTVSENCRTLKFKTHNFEEE